MSFVVDRAKNILMLPIDAIKETGTVVKSTAACLTFVPLSILTLGQFASVNRKANMVYKMTGSPSRLYSRAWRILNPAAQTSWTEKVFCEQYNDEGELYGSYQKRYFNHWWYNGLLTENIATPLFDHAQRASNKSSFLQRHVVSRILYASSGVASVAARIADVALAPLFFTSLVFMSVATFGFVDFSNLNGYTFRQLKVLGVVGDLAKGIRGFINPQQFSASSRRSSVYREGMRI